MSEQPQPRRSRRVRAALLVALALCLAGWWVYRQWRFAALSSQLCQVVARGDARLVEELLEGGADANSRFGYNVPDPDEGSVRRFLRMLSGKSETAATDSETALMRAVQDRRPDIAEMLLRHGADPNAVWSQTTALGIAARRGDLAMIDRLLKASASFDLVHTSSGTLPLTPLMLASARGHLDVMNRLMEAGADAGAATPDGSTALMLAAENNQVAAVKRLLEAGASPDAKDRAGQTAAARARRDGATGCYKLLTGKPWPGGHMMGQRR